MRFQSFLIIVIVESIHRYLSLQPYSDLHGCLMISPYMMKQKPIKMYM